MGFGINFEYGKDFEGCVEDLHTMRGVVVGSEQGDTCRKDFEQVLQAGVPLHIRGSIQV